MKQKFDVEDYTLTASQLADKYSPKGDGQHPRFTRLTWRMAVEYQETINGYWYWVHHQLGTHDRK